MKNPLITIDSLSFGYESDRRIIDNLSLQFYAGEFVGIVGPNGVGKSTLLRLIRGLLVPRSGSIMLNGRSILSYSSVDRANLIGYVQQRLSVTDMTVYEYVQLGMISHLNAGRFWFSKTERNKVGELLEEFEILHLAKKRVCEISGGEQQLAQIARASITSPKLLLLDEPTSHLDVAHVNEIMKKLKSRIDREKVLVIAVLHDIHCAVSVSDRLCTFSKDLSVETLVMDETISADSFEQVFNTSFIRMVEEGSGRQFFVPKYCF